MWLWLSLISALLLGFYDVSKKKALRRNEPVWILFAATALSTLFLSPFLGRGDLSAHLHLVLKALLVTTSWVSGMIALKLLPITTASTLKATRPMFVVLFSIILFGEKLNILQWGGVLLIMVAIWLLSRSSQKEGIDFKGNRGIVAMCISIISGVASALFDKHIMAGLKMEPLFVQSWANFYITLMLGAILLLRQLYRVGQRTGCDASPEHIRFKPDWWILLIAVFITAADACYFFALQDEDALLAVVSMVRRCSVVITFVVGGLLFREKHLQSKALSLGMILVGIALLMFGTI